MPVPSSCALGHQWQPLNDPGATGPPRVHCVLCGLVQWLDASLETGVVAPAPPTGVPAATPTQPGDGGAAGADVDTRPPAASPDTSAPFLAAPSSGGSHVSAFRGMLPRVPGYEILRVLGRGGMGVVYLARQTSLKRLVALKMVLAGAHAGGEELTRFRAEAEAVARLQHPNIVQIYEIGEFDGLPYISLEFVDGSSLDRRLHGRPATPEEAAVLTEALARAMHHAHQRGVVHRDLKPANVLLRIADCRLQIADWSEPPPPSDQSAICNLQSAIPLITDFGLAKRLEAGSGQTQSGAIMGTPSYMAPEQAAGRVREIGPPADIYALGGILYEMLTGQPPFRAASVMQTLHEVLTCDPVPPSRRAPGVPRDLETICLKCLAKAPEGRYPSALGLAQDLERHRAGEPILARRQGPIARAWRGVRRRAGAVVAMVAVLAAALVLGLFLHQGRGARHAADLRRAIDAGLDAPNWTAAFLDELEGHLTGLERLEPEEAAAARARTYGLLTRSVESAISSPEKLQAADFARIEEWLGLLGRGAADAVPRLRVALDQRRRGWEPVLDIGPPFAEAAERFPAMSAEGVDGGLRSRARGNPAVLTAVSCDGLVRAEAVFERWETAPRVGLVLNGRPEHAQRVSAIAVAPDGKRLYSASGYWDRPGEVIAWDLVAGRHAWAITLPHNGWPTLALAPDGATLAVASPAGRGVLLLDTATGRERGRIHDTTGILAVAWAPDGRTLALAGGVEGKSGFVAVGDVAPGGVVRRLAESSKPLRAVAYSPDGAAIAAGGDERTLRVWDVATGQLRHQREGLSAALSAVAYAPDGRHLAGAAKSVLVWDAELRPRPGPQHGDGEAAIAVGWLGARTLASATPSSVQLWDTVAGQMLGRRNPPLYERIFTALGTSADGPTLVWAADDRTLSVGAAPSLEPRQTLRGGGYRFLVQPVKAISGEGGAAEAPVVEVLIERDDAVLRRLQIPAPTGPLRLAAAREGSALTLRVNDLEPLICQDLFPRAGGDPGTFGVQWPAGVVLTRLQGFRQSLPPRAAPLERGDDHFARGRFSEALAVYQELAGAGGPAVQEARYKEALCLKELGRGAEADRTLERLAAEPGKTWPPLAACQLWLQAIRNSRLDEADTIFESLSTHHRFEELVGFLPDTQRTAIVQAYQRASGTDFLVYQPNRVRNLERGVAVSDYLQAPTSERAMVRRWLFRGAWLEGRDDLAEQMVRELRPLQTNAGRPGSELVLHLPEYLWFLHRRHGVEQALRELEPTLAAERSRHGRAKLLYDRARLLVLRGDAAGARRDIEEARRDEAAFADWYNTWVVNCLLEGFVHEAAGDAAAADTAWRRGLAKSWLAGATPEQQAHYRRQPSAAAVSQNLLLGSLTGDLTDADVDAEWARLGTLLGGESTFGRLMGRFRPPTAAFREAFRSTRGRDWARKLALRDLTFAESYRIPLCLIGMEWLHHEALPGPLSPEHDELLWQVARGLFDRYYAGKLSLTQVGQIGLAWKGTTNFLGWAGVSGTLDPEVRGPLAYVLGHKYRKMLGKPQEALGFFRTAVQDAPPGSVLARLAKVELESPK